MAVVDAPIIDDEVFDDAPGSAGLRLPAIFSRFTSVNSRRVLGMALVLVLLAVTLAVPVRTYWSQRGEFNRLQAANEQLARDVEHYQRRVTEQNDPAYIEAAAREQLQYVMPGEKPLVLTYPSREQQEKAQEKERKYASNPWYQNLWDAVSTPPEDK
ncbi:septum formation initiator family protein [Gordonia alkaliphila]|uniref:FtsB family cell division protein n=1 Tax=Gordonia alkaliphila TaxID=1053547 RepID=UPI001FF49C9E|nr:septum formation initiator family protein [Gordonia alkaliphila]MCK0439813.1 septum formation initiator family protein [Gordonia alkaliphila]